MTSDASGPAAARPRLGAVSFLHRFGSALNHHMHLHVCATEGVFVPAADGAGCDASPAFLPARPINQADLAALTERVRRRVIHWFRLTRLLDTAAAADMLTWENSGFSVDASVRIALNRPRRAELFSELGAPAAVLKHRHRYHGVFAPNHKPRSHDTSRIAWAKLMARVGEVFPLACPTCGGDIRLREDGRQEPAHFEPEVRKRAKARMASPA